MNKTISKIVNKIKEKVSFNGLLLAFSAVGFSLPIIFGVSALTLIGSIAVGATGGLFGYFSET